MRANGYWRRDPLRESPTRCGSRLPMLRIGGGFAPWSPPKNNFFSAAIIVGIFKKWKKVGNAKSSDFFETAKVSWKCLAKRLLGFELLSPVLGRVNTKSLFWIFDFEKKTPRNVVFSHFFIFKTFPEISTFPLFSKFSTFFGNFTFLNFLIFYNFFEFF